MNRTHLSSAAGPAALVAAVLLAACGSSSPSSGGSSSQSSASGGSAAAITISAATVPGLGTVLVNGNGLTIYVLSSEKGGKLTCTDDNGCTKVWPDIELPSGVSQGIAGSGVQASLLSTVKASDGSLYLSYGGYPLYTYSGDTGPLQSHGEGIVSFGGTWWAMSPVGTPVTAASSGGSSSAGGASPSASGYGY